MPQTCIVRIPTPYTGTGTGSIEYSIRGVRSSCDAARRALAQRKQRIEDVVTVIVAERLSYELRRCPAYRHRVKDVWRTP